MSGWIGVDLDGTLAHHPPASGFAIGRPIEPMRLRVLQWIADGIEVRIFTARACDPQQIPLIEAWLDLHGIGGIPITNTKDFEMIELWDDRAVHVARNTGEPCCSNTAKSRTEAMGFGRILRNVSRGNAS